MEENKTNINWYPGHMIKTKRQIIEDLKLIDVVIEVLDARIPASSQNPDIKRWIQGKQKIIILNKSDLANEIENKKWKEYFEKQGIPTAIVNSNSGEGVKEAIRKIEEIYSENKVKYEAKGRTGKAVKVMVLGIPNVGKSSFINRITKKSLAQVGNKPGVTKQKQWVRINGNIELLDTPGVLWPKFENEKVALNLAYTGTIKDEVLQTIEVGYSLLKYLICKYKLNLVERYKLDTNKVEEILSKDTEENDKALMIMDEIGRKRGALLTGGQINQEKVAKIILEDFRSGKLGRITLETLT